MELRDLPPGERLKRLRESLGLSLRDVEERSERMAADKDIQDLSLSRNWLAMIESGGHVPSMFKLYALSAIYSCKWSYLNSLFNLRMSDLAKDQLLYGVPRTRLLPEETEEATETVALPLHFQKEEQELSKTNLLNKLVAFWGEVPIPLVRLLSPEKMLYGFVGLDDDTLAPIIRPGSLVQIDVNQTKILNGSWTSEHDRPVYFVELHDAYAFGWCELKRGVLSLIPHPKSSREIRRFEHPREAEIVGRVTAVAMRLAKSVTKDVELRTK